jgi:hypothetical protein
LGHLVVKRNFLCGRGFVGRKDARRQLPPHGRAAHVGELLPPEALHELVEARGGVHVEAAEEDGAVLATVAVWLVMVVVGCV